MGSKFKKFLKKVKKAKKSDRKKAGIKFTSDKKKIIGSLLRGRGQGRRKTIYLPDPGGGGGGGSSRSESSSSSSSSSSPSFRSEGGGGGGESSGQRTTGPTNEQGFSFYEGTEGMTPAEFDLYKDIKLRGIDSKNANKLQNIINKGKLEVAVIQRDASIYGSLVSGFW